MKKIKIMLTAVIVLATVGGALAIKVKRENEICTANTKSDGTCGAGTQQNPFQVCVGKVLGQVVAQDGAVRCTASPNALGNCPNSCPILVRTATD